MSTLNVNTSGILTVLTGGSNESHILQAPGGVKWTLLADATTGALTVTDGATGTPETLALFDANQTAWILSIDDNGVLTVKSFDGTVTLAPAINAPVKINGVPAAGYELHLYQAGTGTGAITYKNGSFVAQQPTPIVLNAYGLPTDPIFVIVGQYYDAVLTPPGGGLPVYTWSNLSGGIPTNIGSPTEWVQPALSAMFATTSTFTVAGDQRTTLKPGRRLQCVGSSTLYGTLYSATYDGTQTTVSVLLDSGVIDTSLATVAYALVNPAAPVIAGRRHVGTQTNLAGGLTLDVTKGINLLTVGAMALHINPAPAGWLKCDGSAISRTTYALLLAAITVTQTGTTTNTSAVITGLTDTSKLNTGMKVSGTGIQAATVINSIDSPTQVTLSLAATASGSVPLLFSNFGIGDGSTTFNVPNIAAIGSALYCIYAQA